MNCIGKFSFAQYLQLPVLYTESDVGNIIYPYSNLLALKKIEVVYRAINTRNSSSEDDNYGGTVFVSLIPPAMLTMCFIDDTGPKGFEILLKDRFFCEFFFDSV